MGVVREVVRWSALALLLAASPMRLEAQSSVTSEGSGGAAASLVQTAAPAQATQQDPPRRSWAGRHPVILGTLIGAGSVAALGAAGRGNGNPGLMAGWVLGGAGGGALAGSIASAIQKARLDYHPPANQADAGAVKRIVARLGEGEEIIVTAANGQQIRGRIQSVDDDEFGVVPDGQSAPVRIAYAEVRSARAKPAGVGKKVGIAAAIVGGIALSWLVCYGAGGCGGVS